MSSIYQAGSRLAGRAARGDAVTGRARARGLRSSRPAFAWLLLVLAVAAIALGGCAREPDEQLLRKRLAAMVAALEAREPARFMAGVDPDFIGQQGQIDRRTLNALVRAETLRHRSLGITLGPIDVTMHGERATVRFKAFTRGGSGGFIPEQAGVWEVESGWKKGGEDWVVYTARWEHASAF